MDSGIALLWWESTKKGLVTVALTSGVYLVLLADRAKSAKARGK